MQTGIQIGAHRDTVLEARKAILDIMNVKADSTVIIKGLDALTTICQVKEITILNNTFGK